MKPNQVTTASGATTPGGRRWLAARACVLGLAVLGATLSTHAVAGCAPNGPWKATMGPPEGAIRMQTPSSMSAVYRPDDAPRMLLVDDRDFHDAAIVGTWRFTLTSDGTAYPVMIPFGAVVDFGTTQWHPDGTELMISGGRPPSSGDVCAGSWEQTGRSTYKLKHIGMSWSSSDTVPSASPATFLGPAIIRETVTVNRAGTAFEGTFTIDQYAKDELTLIEHIAGKVSATRFLPD